MNRKKRKTNDDSFDEIIGATILSVSAATLASNIQNDNNCTVKPRSRKTVDVIFKSLGSRFVRRAYRMSEQSFWKLCTLLHKNDISSEI